MGVALVVVGLVATILSAVSHWMTLRRLRSGEQLIVSQLAFDHYHRCTHCGSWTLRALVRLRLMGIRAGLLARLSPPESDTRTLGLKRPPRPPAVPGRANCSQPYDHATLSHLCLHFAYTTGRG
jgi:hypothetical protein